MAKDILVKAGECSRQSHTIKKRMCVQADFKGNDLFSSFLNFSGETLKRCTNERKEHKDGFLCMLMDN